MIEYLKVQFVLTVFMDIHQYLTLNHKSIKNINWVIYYTINKNNGIYRNLNGFYINSFIYFLLL